MTTITNDSISATPNTLFSRRIVNQIWKINNRLCAARACPHEMIRNWPESLKETKDMRERVKILWEVSFPITNFPFFLSYSLFSVVPQFAPTRSQQVRGLCADQCRVSCLTNRRGMVEGHARMIPSLSAVFHRPFSSFSGTVAHISIRFVYLAAFAPDFLLCATPSSWGREMTWVRLRTSLQPDHPGKELLRWRQTVPASLLRELSNGIGVIGELTSVGPVAIVTWTCQWRPRTVFCAS